MTRVFFLLLKAFINNNLKQRYESRHELLSILAKKWGLRVYNKNLYWFYDEEYLNAFREFNHGNKFINDRKFTLYYLAKSVAHLEGNTAECGVFEGGK